METALHPLSDHKDYQKKPKKKKQTKKKPTQKRKKTVLKEGRKTESACAAQAHV